MALCRVAGLDKENSLACVPRLAWNHLPRNVGATETGTDPSLVSLFSAMENSDTIASWQDASTMIGYANEISLAFHSER